jgi:hypothetical protein
MDRPGTPDPYLCTSGFSVLNENLNPRMVTAGHCPFNEGDTVISPGGTSFGVVKSKSQFPTVDAMLIGAAGIGQGPSIYVGGATGQEAGVVGGYGPTGGGEYCFSGATLHQQCGFSLIDPDFDFQTGQGWIRHLMRYRGAEGTGSCGGDSGAPFYTPNDAGNVLIRGLVSGGNYTIDPPGESGCDDSPQTQTDVLVMKWPLIRDAYSVTLKTIL